MNQPLFMSALLLSGFLAIPLWSQTSEPSPSVEVLDPSGAAVPDAAISAENVQTGVVSRARSNHSGVYLFPALQPGSYRLTAEHPGFQKFVYNDLILDVGAQLTVNVALTIGRATETVQVEAAGEQLQTTTA